MRWMAGIVAALLVFAAGMGNAQSPSRRIALIIGNSAYAAQGVLTNPGPDSRLVAEALRGVGFMVVVQNDLGKSAMERALRDFSRQADGAEVALIYYAGHGLEANGVNWLLPVDVQLADERDLPFEAISLDTVLGTVERARGLRMIVLDACRNNPFARSMRRSATTRATVTRGLADVEVTGTLVLYAARGGTVAQDGPSGGNSPFAAAFARRVPEPGLDVRLFVSKVRDDVLAATANVQEPFSYGSLPGDRLVLAAFELPLWQQTATTTFCDQIGEVAASAISDFRAWRVEPPVTRIDAMMWRTTKTLPGAFECFVFQQSRFPGSTFTCAWNFQDLESARAASSLLTDQILKCSDVQLDWQNKPRIGRVSLLAGVVEQRGGMPPKMTLSAYIPLSLQRAN